MYQLPHRRLAQQQKMEPTSKLPPVSSGHTRIVESMLLRLGSSQKAGDKKLPPSSPSIRDSLRTETSALLCNRAALVDRVTLNKMALERIALANEREALAREAAALDSAALGVSRRVIDSAPYRTGLLPAGLSLTPLSGATAKLPSPTGAFPMGGASRLLALSGYRNSHLPSSLLDDAIFQRTNVAARMRSAAGGQYLSTLGATQGLPSPAPKDIASLRQHQQAISLPSGHTKKKRCPPAEKRVMPADYQPSPDSVIIGKGRMPRQAPGNKELRKLVAEYVDMYSKGAKKVKTRCVNSVFAAIQKNCGPDGGAFVRLDDNGRWYEVSDSHARDKITAAFRDALGNQYKSSTQAKVAKRRAMKHYFREVCQDGHP